MQEFEKLGVFYLGKTYDPAVRRRSDEYLLYNSKDLTTHAICVGMTGSGKTGLCVNLLEEAAIDGIPALIIDPKGDMSNLMLNFAQLTAEDLLPWVNADEAAGQGLSAADFARAESERWIRGLAEWEQTPDRARMMREQASFEIYTPGSLSGRPLNVLRTLSAPDSNPPPDKETLYELAGGTVSGILSLIGLDVDPLQSREHILLSNILLYHWSNQQSLDLENLIQAIQTPPFRQIGVMDLELFYPAKERFNLAMRFNHLLASPQSMSWLQGEPLDIDRLLYTEGGRAKISILSLSHLDEREQMFFVSLLLNQIVAWTRAQTGTGSLRAILYMDEIFGFFPPVANPPSKKPLLTLLKQARAYGLGVVLTTQNPVDLDYKGLSNIGTWLIGRLRTDRDRARLLDGLESASEGRPDQLSRAEMDKLLSGLDSRVFLMNNVHENAPVLFESRWCLSYLAGPLSREQIQRLALAASPEKSASNDQPRAATVAPESPVVTSMIEDPMTASPESPVVTSMIEDPTSVSPTVAPESPPSTSRVDSTRPPTLKVNVPQYFLPSAGLGGAMIYRPTLLGIVQVTIADEKKSVNVSRQELYNTPIVNGPVAVDWNQRTGLEIDLDRLLGEPTAGITFAGLNPEVETQSNHTKWRNGLQDYVYRNSTVEILYNPAFKEYSAAGEEEREFIIRLRQLTRERRDEQLRILRDRYAKRIAALQEKVRKADQALQREEEQAKNAKSQVAISLGSTILGAFIGRNALSVGTVGKAATTARGASRSQRQAGDVARSKETLATYQADLEALEKEFQTEVEALAAKLETDVDKIETVSLKPLKRDCLVQSQVILWLPYQQGPDGLWHPAWRRDVYEDQAR